MANTIDNFLVGLGFKYDDKGVKKFNSSLSNIKSKALQLGAVLGTSFAAKSLIFDRSEIADNMGKFANQVGVTANNVVTLGEQFKLMGSDANGAMSTLQTLSRMQSASIPQKTSVKTNLQAEGLPSSVATDIYNSKDAYSAYIKLIEDGNKLTQVQQRRLLGVLGLNEKIAIQMQQNPKNLKSSLLQLSKVNTNFNQLSKESEVFNEEWDKLKFSVSSIGDNIALDILPPLSKALSMFNELIDKHPKATKVASEIGLGVLASSAVGAGVGTLKGAIKGEGLLSSGLKGGLKGLTLPGKIAVKGTSSILKKSLTLGLLDTLGTSLSVLAPKDIGDAGLSPEQIAFNKKFNSGDDVSPKTIHVNLSLDGETIAKKVIDINNKNNTQAVHNIQSSIKG